MDPILNPYAPGAGSRPPALTGRDPQIAAFGILLKRLAAGRSAKSMLVTGLRGVGKTVLLQRFRDMAEQVGYRTGDVEITHDTAFKPTMARLSRRILLALDPAERVKDKVWQAARVFKAFSLKLPEGYEIGLDVDAVRGRADSGDLGEDLGDLFIALGEAAAERGTGVVLLFDEMQFLERRDLEALIAAYHHAAQRELPLTIAGAGLPLLARLAGEAKSYAERLFDFPVIDRLSDDAAREALERPAGERDASFEPAATRAILAFTEGYPYFIQEFGLHVWNVAAGPTITLADAQAAKRIVLAQLDENFFRVRIARTAPAERHYLSAMASLGPGPYATGDIARALGKPVTAVAPVRAKLIEKGLIYSPEHGANAFTVPHFDDFVRRAYPHRQTT